MPRYVSLIKYSPEALAAARAEGYAARVEGARRAMESIGGTLEGMHFIGGGQWDIVVQMSVPSSAAMFDMGHMTGATGTFERSETYEIFTGEEADEAHNEAMSWAPPGSS